VIALWYGGEREGAADVAIYASWLQPDSESWSTPRQVISREQAEHDLGLHLRKLGNAVLLAGDDNNVWMFFVTASIGGWSTSHINMVHSRDGGHSWGRVVRLRTSPFLNISTLVKGHPFFYADGTIGLPVYHELAGKFSELLRLERNGKVIDKIRMSSERRAIQPDIVLLGEREMLAVMRNTSGTAKMYQVLSRDNGETWGKLQETSIPNPNSAVTLDGRPSLLVLAYNDSDEHRNPLSLAVSTDRGKSWKKIADIEKSPLRADNNKDEFSYPYLLRTRAGMYHLFYTWKRTRIAHVSFSEDWITGLQ
jgi:predicted neuraminidase